MRGKPIAQGAIALSVRDPRPLRFASARPRQISQERRDSQRSLPLAIEQFRDACTGQPDGIKTILEFQAARVLA